VAQVEDIVVFRSRFLNLDHAYSDRARAEANECLEALEHRAGTTSPEAFIVELCAITALADNAHSQCCHRVRRCEALGGSDSSDPL